MGVFLQCTARTRGTNPVGRLSQVSEDAVAAGTAALGSDATAARFDGLEEFENHFTHAVGGFDEFDTAPVGNALLVDVRNAGMRDPSLENDRVAAQRQPEFVKRVDREGKPRLHQCPAPAELLDVQRFEHHDFALQIAQHGNPPVSYTHLTLPTSDLV